MIRAPMGDSRYWNKWGDVQAHSIAKKRADLLTPAANPDYEPEYILSLAQALTEHLIQRYSRGDRVSDLAHLVPEIVDAWEKSNRASDAVCQARGVTSCRDWVFSLHNLRHYNWCFWLVSFALTLEVDDDTWKRLVALVGDEGEDTLLDRIISSRSPGRRVGTSLCHRKPYGRLQLALDAPTAVRPQQLADFVQHWYAELLRKGEQRLWWYDWCDPERTPLDMGNYFGCWCFEAAVVSKVFVIDDSLCLGHPHYPGDILRPDGPSTHPKTLEQPLSLGAQLGGLFKRFVKR